MTGATVVIYMKSGKVWLGEVRHSGYDVIDFFVKDNIKDIPFDQLWGKYLAWRRQDYSEDSLASEICDTDFDGGVFFDFNPTATTPAEIYSQCETAAFDYLCQHTTQKDHDGYDCSYCDYIMLITYDADGVLESCLTVDEDVVMCENKGHENRCEDSAAFRPSFAAMLNQEKDCRCHGIGGLGFGGDEQPIFPQGTIVKIGGDCGWDVRGKVCGSDGVSYVIELLEPVEGYAYTHVHMPAYICTKADE